MKKCGLFTNIAPLYTRPLWIELSSSGEVEYTFYSSRNGFSGIKTIDIKESDLFPSGIFKWRFLRNVYAGNLLVFQFGVILKFLFSKYDAFVLSGEMHILSNWIAGIICKIRRKPLLIWGHGIYGDESSLKKILRLWFYKLADYQLLYGERARKLMIGAGFDPGRLVTVFNSLDYKYHSHLYERTDRDDLRHLKNELFPNCFDKPVIVFIGRLTKEKKLSYLLEAVHLSKSKGNSYNCLIIGNGPEMNSLKRQSDVLGMADNVCFYGPCYDEEVNARFLILAECCVSPGNVGLTAIHAMSFGTPVITHDNMANQGPEAEAIRPDETGFFFEENNPVSLSETIDKLITKGKAGMEAKCREEVYDKWNPAKQASSFNHVVLESIDLRNVQKSERQA